MQSCEFAITMLAQAMTNKANQGVVTLLMCLSWIVEWGTLQEWTLPNSMCHKLS